MKLAVAKLFARVIGTLSGFLGVCLLWFVSLMLYHGIAERNLWWMILPAAFPLAMAAYLVYAAYSVWFRFAPLTVRHICGALGLLVVTLVARLLRPAENFDSAWRGFAFLGCIVAVFFAY